MSKREWKPGDVAINENHGYRGIYVAVCHIAEHGRMGGACWHNESGLSDPPSDRRRPAVVLDPEDREQVERFVRKCPADWCFEQDEETVREVVDLMQAALREFANPTPPKPDEPQGLGAVVATHADGDYIRTSLELHNPWLNVQDGTRCHWDGVAAVRVLSEGVVA